MTTDPGSDSELRQPAPSPRPPSVDQLARSVAEAGVYGRAQARHAHPLAVDAARAAIARDAWSDVGAISNELSMRRLQRVINATGVLLHTNLGRAPWGSTHGQSATNVEFDLVTGARGHRDDHFASKLSVLTGAEDATIVNNGAAAVMLVIAALAERSGVAVSRGELIEIGGGFRIPDVMVQAGAELVEVGTTNRTHRSDYAAAIATGSVSLIMLIHRSNFEMTGFTSSVDAHEVSDLGVPIAVDLGSGLLDEACPWLPDGPLVALRGEPAVRQTLDRGADLVMFSGDKLLGGPQAGIIAGRRELVQKCRRHPLARAFRCGGHVLTALDDVLDRYLDRSGTEIPIWKMCASSVTTLQDRATQIVDALIKAGVDPGVMSIEQTEAVFGGGTLAGRTMESIAIVIAGDRLSELRSGAVAVVARVRDNRTIVDLRSVLPSDDPTLTRMLADVLSPRT